MSRETAFCEITDPIALCLSSEQTWRGRVRAALPAQHVPRRLSGLVLLHTPSGPALPGRTPCSTHGPPGRAPDLWQRRYTGSPRQPWRTGGARSPRSCRPPWTSRSPWASWTPCTPRTCPAHVRPTPLPSGLQLTSFSLNVVLIPVQHLTPPFLSILTFIISSMHMLYFHTTINRATKAEMVQKVLSPMAGQSRFIQCAFGLVRACFRFHLTRSMSMYVWSFKHLK